MFKFILKLLRLAFLGALAAAVAAKFMLESNADPETEEIDLVAIFNGKELKSSAEPFYGGKVTTMFGGVLLDLRDATPSPTGIDIDLAVVMAGVSLVVPEGWNVKTDGRLRLVAAGYTNVAESVDDEDAPTVLIRGNVVMSGLEVTNSSPQVVSTR